MKSFLRTAMLALAASSTHVAAQAAPMTLDASPDAPARRIVNVVFADYLRERIGAEVQTAVVDLDNDGTGEIVARFVHTGSCREDMKHCRTAVIWYDRREWRIVLDRAASEVSYEEHDMRVPGPLDIDGVRWTWGARRYEPDAAGMGKAVAFNEVPQDDAAAYAAAFGEGAKAIANPSHGVKLLFSSEPLSAGAETIVVKMEGEVACGDLSGCPVRVLRKSGDTWATVLSTSTKGTLAVADAQRGGFKDIVVQTGLGYAVLGWNGHGYSVADRVEAVQAE